MNALIRYYFKEDPAKLSDEDWFRRWAELKFCLEFESSVKNIF